RQVDGLRAAPADREVRHPRGDRLAPPAERAVAAERRQRAEDLEERVLEQVLEVAVRAEDPEQRVVDRRALGQEQLPLGAAISGRRAAREVAITVPDGGWRDGHVCTVAGGPR